MGAGSQEPGPSHTFPRRDHAQQSVGVGEKTSNNQNPNTTEHTP